MIEPIVSVPSPSGLNPAAMATADPVDDPPGDYCMLIGFFNCTILIFTNRVSQDLLALFNLSDVRGERLAAMG